MTEAGDKVASAGTNVKETVEHEMNKPTAPGEKTYLEQAQDMAATALNTASKAASGKLLTPTPPHLHAAKRMLIDIADLASSISGEKK